MSEQCTTSAIGQTTGKTTVQPEVRFPLKHFVLSKQPIKPQPHPQGSKKPHAYYKKSQSAGERDLVKANYTKGVYEDFWLYSDRAWFEIGALETATSSGLDQKSYHYVIDNLPKSTKKIILYHNHPALEHSVEGPSPRDFITYAKHLIFVKSFFLNVKMEGRIVTPSGVYVMKLRPGHSRADINDFTGRVEAANKSLTRADFMLLRVAATGADGFATALHLKARFPGTFKEKYGLDKKASISEENSAFCEHLNGLQQIWKFSFIPTSPDQK
ncbi:hypothetical protein ACFL4J_01080 [Candidatus Margulisiibacteriota bacterium]